MGEKVMTPFELQAKSVALAHEGHEDHQGIVPTLNNLSVIL